MTTKKFKPATDNLYRLSRGGSWVVTSAPVVRAAYRYDLTPTFRYNDVGFRCAQRGSRQPFVKVTP